MSYDLLLLNTQLTPFHLGFAGIPSRLCVLLVFASVVSYVLRSNLSTAGERMIGNFGLTKV